jgi:hypothetical protein
MQIIWQIDSEDVAKVREFFDKHRESPFVCARISNNLSENKPPISKAVFWERMAGCLLTTQQPSGPQSAVSRFLTRPFALDYEVCLKQPDVAKFARAAISGFNGLRR